MSTTSLTIGARTYVPTDLLAWQDDRGGLSDNERAALDFCRRWLSGDGQFVVHTSGSTGAPKPISLRREQMTASALATGEALGLQTGMTALVCLPMRYIAGQMMLVRGLVLGLSMTLVEPASDPFASLPADTRVDFTALVPLQLETLLNGPPDYLERLNKMQAILVGGAPISYALEERIRTLAAPVYHTYGMTETATHIALRRFNGPAASPDFRPLPGVEIDIDARGCLRVKGPMTQNQWLQSNDLIQLSTPHSPFHGTSEPRPHHPGPTPHTPLPTFRWLGRWDNVINTGGIKVQVEKVEAAVGQVWRDTGLAERRAFVTGLPDQRLGQAITLVIEGEPLDATDEAALRAAVAANLDPYEAPRQLIYLPRFALTDTGKIDRAGTQSALDKPAAGIR